MNINTKAALKREIEREGDKLTFTTLTNEMKSDRIGEVRTLGTKNQTNAFTISTMLKGELKDSWVYYSDIERIENNVIYYRDVDISILVSKNQ